MTLGKTCTKCNIAKPLEEFGKQSANKDGLMYYCKSCIREYHKARYADPKYKDYQRNTSLMATYGITLEDYHIMLDEQGGVCAICGLPERRKHARTDDPMFLAVDHDHNTGQVRALLCSTCNIMLGHAQDDVSILARAIQYLTEWEVKND
jgi:hypothetical protein